MKIFFTLCLLFFYSALFSQSEKLPLTIYAATDTTKPLIFYLSGDGGWNNFSSSLAEALNKNGYPIAGLNSKSYFWEKKTPEQTSSEIAAWLETRFAGKKNQQFIMAGYSFGADVIPFIVNFLPPDVKKKMIGIVLLAPSASTDFEIHWSDIFGWNKKRSMDVVAGINKLGLQKTILIGGDNESDFPVNEIILKNFFYESLPGGHHFEGNTEELAKTVMKYFK
jgi:type IV secretory pathway VirJ component